MLDQCFGTMKALNVEFGLLIYWNTGIWESLSRESRNMGRSIIGCLKLGILESWNTRISQFWNTGTLSSEMFKLGSLEFWDARRITKADTHTPSLAWSLNRG